MFIYIFNTYKYINAPYTVCQKLLVHMFLGLTVWYWRPNWRVFPEEDCFSFQQSLVVCCSLHRAEALQPFSVYVSCPRSVPDQVVMLGGFFGCSF